MAFKLIVAMDNHFGIGMNNTLPWKCKEDMRFFSKTTKGGGNNAIVMGRKTWNSIGNKPLPSRNNYILSNKPLDIPNEFQKNTFGYTDVDKLISDCMKRNYDEIWIIGGKQIYELFLNKNIIEQLYITRIAGTFTCDTFLNVDTSLFKENERSKQTLTNAESLCDASVSIWEKKNN